MIKAMLYIILLFNIQLCCATSFKRERRPYFIESKMLSFVKGKNTHVTHVVGIGPKILCADLGAIIENSIKSNRVQTSGAMNEKTLMDAFEKRNAILRKNNSPLPLSMDRLKRSLGKIASMCKNAVFVLYANTEEGIAFGDFVKDAFIKIGNNPVGKQLLLDIVLQNESETSKNPIIILNKEIYDLLPRERCGRGLESRARILDIDIELEDDKLLKCYVDIEDEDKGPFFQRKNEYSKESRNFILYKKINVPYPTIAINCTIDSTSHFITHDINDVIFFHELNHYRHALLSQNDYERRLKMNLESFESQTSPKEISFQGIKVSIKPFKINLTPWRPMHNAEEALQLFGYVVSPDHDEISVTYDFVNETAYRLKQTHPMPLRFPYQVPQDYISGSYTILSNGQDLIKDRSLKLW